MSIFNLPWDNQEGAVLLHIDVEYGPMLSKLCLLICLFALCAIEVVQAQTPSRQSFQRGSILTQKKQAQKRTQTQIQTQIQTQSPGVRQQQIRYRNQNTLNNSNFVPVTQTRVNNGRAKVLYQVQSILSYIANGFLIVGCVLGGPVMLFGFIQLATGANDGIIKVVLGLCGICGGLATPFCIDLLFKFACENGLI